MEPYFGSPAGVSHALHTSLPRPSTEERHQRAMFPTIPPDPEQILVGMLLPIGDTLLATPALAALRQLTGRNAESTAAAWREALEAN